MGSRDSFKELIYLKRRISSLKERRSELEAAAERMTINLTGMPSAHSGNDSMATFAAQVDEIDRKILDETLRLEKMRLEVEDYIEGLPMQQKIVMHLRYVKGYPWRKVAGESGLNIDHCRKIERAAIKNVTENKSCPTMPD